MKLEKRRQITILLTVYQSAVATALLAGCLLFTKSPVLAASPIPLGEIEGLPGGYNPEVSDDPTKATEKLTKIFSNTFGVLTIVAGLMFILYFVLGGIQWITAGGDAEKVEKAKSQMTNAAIGLIIVVGAYGIAFIIGQVLGIDILNPAEYIIKNLGPGGK